METTDWRLYYLNIHESYESAKKGTYEGDVTFKDGQKMQVAFKLDQAQCHQFLALIQNALTESAKDLGSKLVMSLPVALPPSPTNLDL